MDRGPSLDLSPSIVGDEVGELRMDHDHGPVGIGVARDAGRAHRHQRVGASGVGERALSLAGHHRDALGHPLERSSHDGPLGRGQLALQTETPAIVQIPP